jgi:dipeptidyl aminopeptidase/acylaminoacyl peptidase
VAAITGTDIEVWDARTGQPLLAPLKHGGRIHSVRWSPDGTRLITACMDGTARIWDAATGHPACDPLRHTDRVQYAEFSPDNRWAVTASYDRTARLWEIMRAPIPVPAGIPELAEAVVGQRLDERGVSQTVPVEQLLRVKNLVSGAASAYAAWSRWFGDNSYTRVLSPSSPVRVPELAEQFMGERDPELLQAAVALLPTNRLALARLASALATSSGTTNAAALAEASRLARTALDWMPESPEAWLAQGEVLFAQGQTNEGLRWVEGAITRQRGRW